MLSDAPPDGFEETPAAAASPAAVIDHPPDGYSGDAPPDGFEGDKKPHLGILDSLKIARDMIPVPNAFVDTAMDLADGIFKEPKPGSFNFPADLEADKQGLKDVTLEDAGNVLLAKDLLSMRGLAKAGKNAAVKAVGALEARTGEELVQEVVAAAKGGDTAKLNELVQSGKTNLFFNETLKNQISQAKDLSKNLDYLNATKIAVDGSTAVPLKSKSTILKIEDTEKKLADFVAQDDTKRIQDLINRRDKLAQKNFTSPSDSVAKQIKDLNAKIQETIRARDVSRVDKIEEYRTQISDLHKDMQRQTTDLSNSITSNIVRRETQLESLKTGIKGKLETPIEKELVEGLLRTPDSGVMPKYVRAPMQGMTFLADTMDKTTNGAFSRYVLKPQLEAEGMFDKLASKYLEENAGIYGKHGITPDQDTAFRLFREGKAAAPKGLEQSFKNASDEYTKVVKSRLDAYNVAAEKIGMPKIDPKNLTSEDYVFHTKKMNALMDLNAGDIRDVPKDAMFVRHNDPIFHSYKRRFDAIPEDQLAGAFEALDKYSMNIARVEAYGPMANKFRALARASTDMGKASFAEQFNMIADRLTGDAGVASAAGLQKATGGLAKPGLMNLINKEAGVFAKNAVNSASAAIGNLGASVINALYMGPRRAAASMIEGMSKDLFEHVYKAAIDPTYSLMAKKYSKVLPIHGYERPLNFLQRNASAGEKLANLYQSVPKAFFSYMNDSMNVGTWNQAFKAARKSGYEFKQSVEIADNLVMRTQAIYRDAFRPAVLSSSSKLGQIMAPLSTYVFNSANAITQDVLAGDLTFAEKAQALAGAAAAGIFTNFLTDAMAGKKKIDPGDFIPMWRSMQYGFGALGVPKQVARDIKSGHYLRGAIKAGAMLTPYGSAQIPQTIAGVESILQGKTEGPIDSARAVVFGPQKGKYPK